MTAATQDIKSDHIGTEGLPPPDLYGMPVAANVQIFGGTFAANNSSGQAVPATSAAAIALWGRVERQINNLTSNSPYGAAGAQSVLVRPGAYYFSSDGSVTAGMGGQAVFALDDNTVTTNPTKAGVTYWLPFAGMVVLPGVGDFNFSPTDATKVPVYVGFPSFAGVVLHAAIPISLATAQGATSGTAFNLGPALPANAVILGYDVNVITPLTGGGETGTTLTVQNTGETAGALIASTQVTSGAPTGVHLNVGSNPYGKRGGQQLQATLTATGGTLAGLTAGSLAVDVYYTIAP